MKLRIPEIAAGILTVLVIFAIVFHLQNAKFSLDSEYYGAAEIEKIDLERLRKLIEERKSFGLLISQSACQASADLRRNLKQFLDIHQVKFYDIDFTSIKDSGIIPDLRFYPSFAIFSDGTVVDFLEANNDEDAPAYTSSDGFTNWFTQYVKIKE